MYFTASDGNAIYYETFGNAASPPLLLIHGSTLTGAQDYVVLSNTAARFADRYRVIVPDCRGHGRSSAIWRDTAAPDEPRPIALPDVAKTRLTYSFSRMARDMAELLAHLGASPAYVAGHSNGGNVALYMAKEQGASVRAAVLLAANAYIDEHIEKRVPRGMDPERVARESVDWMNEMIALHDPHHGPGYWRDLLRATIAETISVPRWTAQDLADVRVPCLCVQGDNDAVNAAGRHAQTLAQWLPVAEAWVPAGVAHSVHWEAADEFERRVSAFFGRFQQVGST
jgi:pimeloyl-ACP methyl ester carboxylesterase